jgi:hypothetical protein
LRSVYDRKRVPFEAADLFFGDALLKSQLPEKRLSPRKKVLTIETDLSMLPVWLQRRD